MRLMPAELGGPCFCTDILKMPNHLMADELPDYATFSL